MSVECKNRTDSDLSIEVEFEYPFRSVQHIITVCGSPGQDENTKTKKSIQMLILFKKEINLTNYLSDLNNED